MHIQHLDCWLVKNQLLCYLKKEKEKKSQSYITAGIVWFIKMATLLPLLCVLLSQNTNVCWLKLRSHYVIYYQHICLLGICKAEWSRSLLLRTGRDSPQSFIGVSVMFRLPPNVKSTPFAGTIYNKNIC